MQRNRETATCRAFTVIELMVVISIIALLAIMTASALSNAAEQARAQRTRAIIDKIDQLVMEKWDSYRTRSIPYVRTADSRTTARNRLYALRELQRLELPQCANDIWDNPSYLAGNAIPAVNRGYRRRSPPLASWNSANEESECLYLIISAMKDGDKNAIEFFSTSEIGDTDQDGLLEILDGWGTPIIFVRWPAGFTSDATTPALTHQVANGSIAPDPFDPIKVDPRNTGSDATKHTYALTPLIFSLGADKSNGIILTGANFQYSTKTPPNDPYEATGTDPKIGSIETPSAVVDDITNHYRGE
jgi:prepilin-type N-terminal cleavage/methylation domain-containing protein